MAETKTQPGGRRLVLGFDAGCMTCSELAKRIEEAVGEKLEIRSLNHPQVEGWREQTLGKDAPWVPTLFEVGGVRTIRAWTGARMAVKLTRALGPVSTWRAMQAMGKVGRPKIATAGISRGQFLKGVGGAALAFGVLSGTASPALADKYDDLDAEALAEGLSVIEDIPDSVIAQGEAATRRWVRNAAQQKLQSRFNLALCATAILNAIISNAIPIFKILKIRKAIKAFGGARKFAAAVYKFYRTARSNGASRRTALRVALARADDIAGGGTYEALLDLFSLEGVFKYCI